MFVPAFPLEKKMKAICLTLISVVALFGCSHRTSHDVHYTPAPGNQFDQSKSQNADQQKTPAKDSAATSAADKTAVEPKSVETMRSCADGDQDVFSVSTVLISKKIESADHEASKMNQGVDADSVTLAKSHLASAIQIANDAVSLCSSSELSIDVANCSLSNVKDAAQKMKMICDSASALSSRLDKMVQKKD
jgi:hypothetical protein